VRVAIVDDHPMYRMGLAVAIAEMDGIEVAGEADRAGEVADLVAATHPDIVLLDVRLGDESGLEVNRWLTTHHPQVKVIMLTMSEDQETALTALHDGAAGYLVKGADPDRLEHALRAAAAGDVVLDHEMARAVTELALTRRRGSAGRPFAELTQREYDVLDLVAQGLDNRAIARRLVLSPKTVRNHISNVLTKLNAADRAHAIVLGRERGLGRAPPGLSADPPGPAPR
jgi:DNA-binding NarL/FixJ family response regulator